MTISRTPDGEAVGTGRVAKYREDELVLGLAYEGVVMSQLQSWGATPVLAGGDRDERLGLGRVRLDAAAAVRFLAQRHADWLSSAREAAGSEGYSASDLDLTVRCLREAFRQRYAGWVPTFAKNRLVERRVEGSYVIDGGGGDGGPQVIPLYVIDGGAGGPGPSPATEPGQEKLVAPREAEPGRGVSVGIVDTRLAAHPWLTGAFIASPGQLRSGAGSQETAFTADHATFVTGLVLRQAPGSVVVMRGALDDHAQSDSWSVARAMADLASSSVDIVNFSFGCATDDGQPPLVLSAAVAALGPQTVVVAAAGNHGASHNGSGPAPSWPAALDNVIAVGALGSDGPAPFSPEAPWVDAFAPGVGVASTCVPDRQGGGLFARWSGTSFASALVTGAIAARSTSGVSAQDAWRQVREESDRDDRDRPLISARTPHGWPPDDPTGKD